MPRPVHRSVADGHEWEHEPSDGVFMGDLYEPAWQGDCLPEEFEYPANLANMSWEEREALHRRHVRHYASRNTADLSPSTIIDPQDMPPPEPEPSPEPDEPVFAGATSYDPELGYVVDGDDYTVLLGRGLDPEEASKRCHGTIRSRNLSSAEAFAAKMAQMPRLEREAEERFGNI